MTTDKQHKEGISFLDLASKLVGAVLATIAAVRAAQKALSAWQNIVSLFRAREEDGALPPPGAKA